MRISSANVGMESARSYASVSKQSSSFVRLSSKGGLFANYGNSAYYLSGTGQDNKGRGQSLPDAMRQMRSSRDAASGIRRMDSQEGPRSYGQVKQKCILYLLDILFHGKRKFPTDDASGAIPSGSNESKLIFGQKKLEYSESENTSFTTTGKVVTQDGREIEFGLTMEMSRSFQARYEENYMFSIPDVCDPLVINLDGNIAGLSDQKFLFDLDGDGEEESISTLASGSGFLALDKNGDGIINDGNELFGTKSGDGFRDLAAYDSDGNGWIDENDPIFEKLMIWTKDENGKDQLYKLTDKGVGAICLRNTATQFSLNNAMTNQTNGYIRSSGIFLFEDGEAGTVQHLDIAK